jgi:hypothetical protein
VEFAPVETSSGSNEYCDLDVLGGDVCRPLTRRRPVPGLWHDSGALGFCPRALAQPEVEG